MRAKITSFLVLFPLALAGDYQAGLDAFNEGDYATAMQEWRTVTDGPPTAVSPGQFIEAHYAVAMLYWEGLGVPQDYSEARQWLLQAAQLNHAGAQVKLGYLYSDGRAVGQDYGEAFSWFARAARQGNVDGLYNLGVFYLYGYGTEADATLAKQYLASAAALGDEAAEEALQDLLAGASAAPAPEAQPEPRQKPSVVSDADWILERAALHYTIQVIALSSMDKIEDLVSGHENLAPFGVYTVQRERRPLYVLVQGDYADVDTARKARDAFPRSLQKPEALWIRRFDKVQALIEP